MNGHNPDELMKTARGMAHMGDDCFGDWFSALTRAEQVYITLAMTAEQYLPRAVESMKLMTKPGVTFTPEQMEKIKAMQEAGEYDAAKAAIIDATGGVA